MLFLSDLDRDPAGTLERVFHFLDVDASFRVEHPERFIWVETELGGTILSVRPIDQWFIDLIPQIIWKMLVVFSKKGAYFVLMFVATVFAIRGMIRLQTPLDRLAIIVGAIFLGYNSFLLFTYVTVFRERDALRAVSLWRYNMHLGPLGMAFATYGLALLWKKKLLSSRPATLKRDMGLLCCSMRREETESSAIARSREDGLH